MSEKAFVSAVILSAGKGLRMGFDKMTVRVGTKSVLERTVEVFEATDGIDEIIIAAPEEMVDEYGETVRKNGYIKVTAVVKGGQTRQASLTNALKSVSKDAQYIAVHDGARPLVREEVIEETIKAAMECGGAVAGNKSVDTLKTVDENMMITGTIDREICVQVKTPQIFKAEILMEAHKKAAEDGFVGTDECMLVERLGHSIKVVESNRDNIKITFPEDIQYMTEVLRERGKL